MSDTNIPETGEVDVLELGPAIVAGVTVASYLLWQEARRRSWVARAGKAIEARKTVAAIQKRHGKIAALAAKMTLAGKVKTAMWLKDNKAESVRVGLAKVTTDGILLLAESSYTLIPFKSITGIDLDEVVTTHLRVEAANLIAKF